MHRRVCRAKADLPAPRWAVVNGKLWLCGGRVRTAARDGTPTVVMYDSQYLGDGLCTTSRNQALQRGGM